MSQRTQQVSTELKHHLSQLLTTAVELPAGCIITITKVAISPNLKTAHSYITVLPENKDKEALTALRKAARHIQKELKPRIRFYTVPQLKFVIDDGEKNRRDISEILNSLPELDPSNETDLSEAETDLETSNEIDSIKD